MGRNKKNKSKEPINEPEIPINNNLQPIYHLRNNMGMQYSYNTWSHQSFQYVNSPRRFYGKYNFFSPENRKREPSPLNGSEEYTQRKIQETSDMIKRQLMNPDSNLPHTSTTSQLLEENKLSTENNSVNELSPTKEHNKRPKQKETRVLKKQLLKDVATQKTHMTYNVREIHDQIMNHISKLNYGRKQNLINSDNSGYDEAIQQIHKQKSLELSKALREMSHQEKPEASEIVNSIIPDFAIKFEELPIHIIRELSSSFEEIDRNIGIVDENTPYDLRNQCMAETYNMHAEMIDTSVDPTYNLPITSEGRIVILNSEDADSNDVQENDWENCIKLESPDVVSSQDSEVEKEHKNITNLQTNEICNDILEKELERYNPERFTNIGEHVLTSQDISTMDNISSMDISLESKISKVPVGSGNLETQYLYTSAEGGSNQVEANNESIVLDNTVSSVPRIRINPNIFDLSTESLQEAAFCENNVKKDSSENMQCMKPRLPVTTTKCNPNNVINEKYKEMNNVAENTKIGETETQLCANTQSEKITAGNVYIDVTYTRKKTPENVKEITEMMFEFDDVIENLIKLRQSIIQNFHADIGEEDGIQLNGRKRKLSSESKPTSNPENKKKSKKKKTVKPANRKFASKIHETSEGLKNIYYIFRQFHLPDTIVISKYLPSLNVLITGNCKGTIQCHDLGALKTSKTVKVLDGPPSCLECECVNNERLIFTGSASKVELTVLKYDTLEILRTIQMQDKIQVINNKWNYFFIGGSFGYLTRYNFEIDKIEFGDSISISNFMLLDMKASTEGARKILIVLIRKFVDCFCQVHVRDAMSGLHIRSIGDFKNATCLHLHLNCVMVPSKEGIKMFNFCDGLFMHKVTPLKGVSKLHSIGNFLIAIYRKGAFVYDILNKKHFLTITLPNITHIFSIKDEVLVLTDTNEMRKINFT